MANWSKTVKYLGFEMFSFGIKRFLSLYIFLFKSNSSLVGHFGGEESYITTVQNDRLKKDKCIMNGCHLIEVLPNYNIDDLVNEINSHIKLTNK